MTNNEGYRFITIPHLNNFKGKKDENCGKKLIEMKEISKHYSLKPKPKMLSPWGAC
jgi:hypothetical protein